MTGTEKKSSLAGNKKPLIFTAIGIVVGLAIALAIVSFQDKQAGGFDQSGVDESSGDNNAMFNFAWLTQHKNQVFVAATYSSDVAKGGSASFVAEGTGGTAPYVYEWSFPDGKAVTGQNVTHAFDKAGRQQVTVTATDAKGQKSAAVSLYIEVK